MEEIIYHQKVPLLIVPLMHREVIKERPPTYLYERVKERFDKDKPAIDSFISEIRPFTHHKHFERIPETTTTPGEPCLKNGWFMGGDARAAYGITAAKNPKRIIEIGSGNSTMFMKRAIRDFGLNTHLTSIDPAPRAEIDKLCDRVIRKTVLEAELSLFSELEEGDLLFHDGSHLTFNGSDTVHLFLDILPLVKPGVIIHIHDIFLPHEYGSCFDRRGYSEQYMLANALLFSSQFEVLLPIAYMDSLKAFDSGCSFWMRKRA